MANPVGRPKKTVKDTLPTDWKSQLLLLMEAGGSLAEVKGTFNISDDLHYRWMEEEPEYSGAIKEGSRKCQLWWQAKGRTNLENKDFSSTLWYMNMKNRFGWRDKQDITSGGDKVSFAITTFSEEDKDKFEESEGKE